MPGLARALLVKNGKGNKYWGPGGDRYEFLVTGEESGGDSFTLLADVPVGGGPPLHAHQNESEAFYILNGSLTFKIGAETVHAAQGDFIHIPRGVMHTYANAGDLRASALVVFSPAGMEGWFHEVLVKIVDEATVPYVYTEAQLQRLIAAGPRYGVSWG